MEALVIVVMVIFACIVLFYVLQFLLYVLMVFLGLVIVGWLPSLLAVSIMSSFIMLESVVSMAMSPCTLAKLIHLHVQGDGMIGQIEKKSLAAYLPKWRFIGANVVLIILLGPFPWVSDGYLCMDRYLDWLNHLDWVNHIKLGAGLSEGLKVASAPWWVLFFGMIASLVLGYYLYIGSQLFHGWVLQGMIYKASKPINDAYQKHQLRNLDSQTAAYAETFGISWPSAGDAVAQYLVANVSRIFQDKREFADAIDEILSQARSDLQHLNAACKQRDQFIANYDRVAIAANRTGQVPLIRELDEIYRGVHSENLMGLLTARRWTEYDEITLNIYADLCRIEQLAKQVDDEDNREGHSTKNEYTVEWALNVLGLEHSATNDQIKDVHNRLVKIYHPDVRHVNSDVKIKEINRAYILLKKDRNFV